MKKTLLFTTKNLTFYSLLVCFLCINYGWSQSMQVIGQFPTMDGGFEAQTAGDLSVISSSGTTSYTNWSIGSSSNSGTRKITDGTGRSGTKFATQSLSAASTNSRMQAPTNPSGNYHLQNTAYVTQFYYRSATDIGTSLTGSIYMNGTSNGSNGATASNWVSGNAWLKYAEVVTTADVATAPFTAGPGNYSCMRLGGTAGAFLGDVDIDDFVVYAGTEADIVAPSPATAGTYTTGGAIGWTASAGGVDGGGYVVVKYTSDPGTGNDPNDNGIYQVGNTIATGGTVVYIGTANTYTDTYAAGNFYKIYAVDKAFNYSAEIVVSDATLGVAKNEIEGLRIYPNPAKNYITIESKNVKLSSVELYNVLGARVLSAKTLNNDRLNISGISKGIYMLKVNAEGASSTKKIVID